MFDSKCLELARHFLQDEQCRTEGDEERFAQAIQDAVEDWLDGRNCPHSETLAASDGNPP